MVADAREARAQLATTGAAAAAAEAARDELSSQLQSATASASLQVPVMSDLASSVCGCRLLRRRLQPNFQRVFINPFDWNNGHN